MEINEWEIWHTYSTYLLVSNIDLDLAARRLVESGVVQCAMLRDGQTYWRCRSGIGSGITVVRLEPPGIRASIKLEQHSGKKCELEGFAAEAWYQGAHFRCNEIRVFGEERAIPPPYVRGFLGQCNFLSTENEGLKIVCYPVLLLYESGVILLEIRTIAPERPVSLEDFISGAVNLFSHSFSKIEVPPGISKLATLAYYRSHNRWRLHHRLALLYLQHANDRAVKKLTLIDREGDFTFELAPLSSSDGEGYYESLSSFALTIFHTVAFILGGPHLGLRFLLRGQSEIPVMGNFWSGRPHIYLSRFEDQRETAKENEEMHGPAFGSILARVFVSDPELALQFLPKDSRVFSDYSAYITSAATLWVWSLSGLRQQEPWADANRGHLIYEPQATSELLEYGYMIYRCLLERVQSYFDAGAVLCARQALLELEQIMSEAGQFGEIRKLLNDGWRKLGREGLKSHIKEGLSIREEETRLAERRVTEKIGRNLTILFGLFAVSPLANNVLRPLWELLGLYRPSNDAAFLTLLNATSLGLVTFIVIGLLWRLGKSRF